MFADVAYIRMQERLFVLVTPSKLLAPSAITTLPTTVLVKFKVSKCVVFISFQCSIALHRTNRLTSHIRPRVHVFIDFKVSFTQCLVTSSPCDVAHVMVVFVRAVRFARRTSANSTTSSRFSSTNSSSSMTFARPRPTIPSNQIASIFLRLPSAQHAFHNKQQYVKAQSRVVKLKFVTKPFLSFFFFDKMCCCS